MARVFITIDWFLPGTNSGGPVRSVANLIEALPECQFYVFTRNTDYCATGVYPDIVSNTWIKFSENCEVFYCSEEHLSEQTLASELLSVNPDVLYVNGVYSKAFSRWPLALAQKQKLKCIVAARGMLSPHALGVKPLKKTLFLAWMRLTNAYKGVSFHATSVIEKADIQKVLGAAVKVAVIPNLARTTTPNIQTIVKEQGTLKLVSIGRIAPEKGTLHALSALRGQKGDLQFDLFGTCYNERYWNECLEIIAQLPANIKVNYHGPCPSQEVAQRLAEAHALLLPSEGENYGHAIVESFGQGRPVLISKHTPWRNLASKKAGWDVSTQSLPQVIEDLAAMDNVTYQSWSKGAAAYYQEQIQEPFEKNKLAYLQLLAQQK